MKPPPFDYYRAASLAEAVDLLATHGPDAKLLAGGQSLLPMMKLRLARPTALVDLNRARDLAYVHRDDGALAFGALARLSELESETVRTLCRPLAVAAPHIGHAAIRHRGTVCGSLAHADPAAELPVLALALDAEMRVRGPRGARTVAAKDFFVTYLTTALEPGEILAEARFPVLPAGAGSAFMELARRHGDYAIVSVACVLAAGADDRIEHARIALGSVADRAVRAVEAEAMLVGRQRSLARCAEAAAAAASQLDPPSDVHGSGAYRRKVAQVLLERALYNAWTRVAPPDS